MKEDSRAGYEQESVSSFFERQELQRADASRDVRYAHDLVEKKFKELEDQISHHRELSDLWRQYINEDLKIREMVTHLAAEQAQIITESRNMIFENIGTSMRRYDEKEIDLATCRAEVEAHISDLQFLLTHQRPDSHEAEVA